MKVFTKSAFRQRRYLQRKRRSLRPGLAYIGLVFLLFSLLILLSACSSIFGSPSQSGPASANATRDPTTPTPVVSPTAASGTPTITLQVTGCPSTPSINWDSLVGTHTNVNKVQKVICGSLEGAGSLDALVDVRYYSSDNKLDYYVYDNLFGTPTQRFSAHGLLNGDAVISSVGTLTTAEVNPGDTIKGAPDLFKEYQWNGSTFVQILFPGIYPDTTRYQADRTQAMVSAEIAALQPGQSQAQIKDSWRLSAGTVAAHLAHDILHWSSFKATLPPKSNNALDLTVTLTNLGTGGGGFYATMHRYNEVSTNIFEVWQVTAIDGSSGIGSPAADAQLTSPVSVSGGAIANGNLLGQIVIYDDMFTAVGTSGSIRSPQTSGYVQFTVSVSYHLGTPGLEEGVVAFYPTNQNNAALTNQAVMIKVFLSA
jgi:hypothetical protein